MTLEMVGGGSGGCGNLKMVVRVEEAIVVREFKRDCVRGEKFVVGGRCLEEGECRWLPQR